MTDSTKASRSTNPNIRNARLRRMVPTGPTAPEARLSVVSCASLFAASTIWGILVIAGDMAHCFADGFRVRGFGAPIKRQSDPAKVVAPLVRQLSEKRLARTVGLGNENGFLASDGLRNMRLTRVGGFSGLKADRRRALCPGLREADQSFTIEQCPEGIPTILFHEIS